MLHPLVQGQNKIFAWDLCGNILGQEASEVLQWKQEALNKVTTFGIGGIASSQYR
jgi:hypothetical protein